MVFLENEILYRDSFEMSDAALSADFVLPFGKAKIEQQGKHVTIVSHSIGVKFALEAAKTLESLGVECEVINLRTVRPIDEATVFESVMKTHHLVTVEGGWPTCGIGSEIISRVCECE